MASVVVKYRKCRSLPLISTFLKEKNYGYEVDMSHLTNNGNPGGPPRKLGLNSALENSQCMGSIFKDASLP
jgi:hypothetical protein